MVSACLRCCSTGRTTWTRSLARRKTSGSRSDYTSSGVWTPVDSIGSRTYWLALGWLWTPTSSSDPLPPLNKRIVAGDICHSPASVPTRHSLSELLPGLICMALNTTHASQHAARAMCREISPITGHIWPKRCKSDALAVRQRARHIALTDFLSWRPSFLSPKHVGSTDISGAEASQFAQMQTAILLWNSPNW